MRFSEMLAAHAHWIMLLLVEEGVDRFDGRQPLEPGR